MSEQKTLAQMMREENEQLTRRFLHRKARAMSPMSMDEAAALCEEMASIGRAVNDIHEAETQAAMQRHLLPSNAAPETVRKISEIFRVPPEKL